MFVTERTIMLAGADADPRDKDKLAALARRDHSHMLTARRLLYLQPAKEALVNKLTRRAVAIAGCAFSLSACSSPAKSFRVNRVSAYGFLRCSKSALATQLRYQVAQPNDSTLIGTRKVRSKTGTLTVNVRGMPNSPVIEVVPKDVPDADRDALLLRCVEWTK